MKKIPLLTSIPPTIVRRTKHGVDVGKEYALQCVNSWKSHGFEPVTINSESEGIIPLVELESIRRIGAQRDAREMFGKPLVYLNDLIEIGRTLTKGPVVITNSDVLLEMTDNTREKIARLSPGQCLISRRTDIALSNSRVGREYESGYDFFAYHSSDLVDLPENKFVFGLPWWDHFLPILMLLRGVKNLAVEERFVFHLTHSARWDPSSWGVLGDHFVELFAKGGIKEPFFGEQPKNYIRDIQLASRNSEYSVAQRISLIIKYLRRVKVEIENYQELSRVAQCNLRWLSGLG